MSDNQSEAPATAPPEESPPVDPVAEYAAAVEGVFGSEAVTHDFGTVKVRVPAGDWTEAVARARDELSLPFFSWLSAVDWSNEVEVGDPPSEAVDERYEVVCALADVVEGNIVLLTTDIAKEEPTIDSLVDVFPGANWHEREAAEMFGIAFAGHPELERLYLPDGFEGHPLRKSFPLLTREVKPWPGKVDVEDMPAEENVEAGDTGEGEVS